MKILLLFLLLFISVSLNDFVDMRSESTTLRNREWCRSNILINDLVGCEQLVDALTKVGATFVDLLSMSIAEIISIINDERGRRRESFVYTAKQISLNVNRAFCFDHMNELLERDAATTTSGSGGGDRSRYMTLLHTRKARCDSLEWHQQAQLNAHRLGLLPRTNNNDNNNNNSTLVKCMNGFEFNGRCYCNQASSTKDRNSRTSYGERCEFDFQNNNNDNNDNNDACQGSRGGVSLLGSCRCYAGRYGEQCREKCISLQRLRACAVLNGRLAFGERLHDIELLERHIGRFVERQEFRDVLCKEAARRWLCHDGDEGVRIAFVVMLHNTRHTWNDTARADREPSSGLMLFRWLLESLWHERHLFAVHVDARAPSSWYFDALSFVHSDARFRRNVLVMQQRQRVVWSSIDVVQTTLDAIRFLLSASSNNDDNAEDSGAYRWDFLINLSGADLALKTPLELQRYLFPRKRLNMLWANYFDAIDESLIDEHLRTTYAKCGERNHVIKLPNYRKRRSLWFMPLKGQFWMTLSREFCEYLFSEQQSELSRFVSYLTTAQVPDEKLFPSMLLHSPFRHSWLRIMDRYIEWQSDANHPTMLRHPQHWSKLTSSSSGSSYIFARKVSFTHSKHLLARLHVYLRTKRLKEIRDELF